jgi:hypothetical protein
VGQELVRQLERRAEREAVRRKTARVLAIEAIGPLTIVGGVVWAIAQPYRIVFIERAGKGFYDYLLQGPVLVAAVGLFFALAVAPALVDDLNDRDAEG